MLNERCIFFQNCQCFCEENPKCRIVTIVLVGVPFLGPFNASLYRKTPFTFTEHANFFREKMFFVVKGHDGKMLGKC